MKTRKSAPLSGALPASLRPLQALLAAALAGGPLLPPCAASLPPALDLNGNGLSDLWERHFNGGELFSPADPDHASHADPDGDSFDNLAECQAGADPFDPAPPYGLFRLEAARHPAGPGFFLLRWHGVAGKKYQLLGSPDLGAGAGWHPVGDPALGDGGPIVQVVEIEDFEAAPRYFWKLAVEDHDTDGDSIADADERLLGSSPYLADSDGDGTDDLDQFAAGRDPSGDGGPDSDGDGVPDHVWYSVVFEVGEEKRSLPAGTGFPPLTGDDLLHRYLTMEIVEEYSVSGSPRYASVSGGESVTTVTYLDGDGITEDGQAATGHAGQTFGQWQAANGIEPGPGETLEWLSEETVVEGPSLSATETQTVTTATRGWRVRKDGAIVRSGVETIGLVHRTSLKDGATWQEFWDRYVAARPWEASAESPFEWGPLEWVDYNRDVLGDAAAAQYARDRFRRGDFSVAGTISRPGISPWTDTGSDSRPGSLRWRWVRFDPGDPFHYKYEAPPAGYRQTFRFLVKQSDYLRPLSPPEAEPLADETRARGFAELVCEGGLSGWQEAPQGFFEDYRLAEPEHQESLDFGKHGYSQVSFANLPVKLALDGDRDGAISFDGRDRTTAQRPFRFWVNNDQDDVEQDEPSVTQVPDSQDRDYIVTMRDMEDFCRLKLHVGLNRSYLEAGDIRIGLQFRNVAAGGPSIRVWPNQSHSEGNADYLTDGDKAAVQMIFPALGVASASGIAMIPPEHWAFDSGNSTVANLIFEGVEKGAGELVVTLHDRDGVKIGEAGGAWLHLLDVREMYQRARIVSEPEDIPHPWDDPDPVAQIWEWDPWDWPYVEDPAAENVTAVFVHGWRLTYATYLKWADISYKRLWHQGFKGKFYAFRWATFSGDNNGLPDNIDDELEESPNLPPPALMTYNRSEYRAWLCGPALADFVNQLPDPPLRRRLFAHSMGNVISGAALRAGMEVQFYAMCNAAMAAMAYDTNPVLRDVDDIFLPGSAHVTPDTDADPAIRSGYGIENKFNLATMPQVFSFGLPNDSALGLWSFNNKYLKPHGIGVFARYSYQPSPSEGAYKLNCSYGLDDRQVTSLPEAMGFVTKSLTRAAGADLRTSGCIIEDNVIDMAGWFNDMHSAQWRRNYQSTLVFWQELFKRLELKPN